MFFIATTSGKSSGRTRYRKSILREIAITESQAKSLEVKVYTQLSPYLEKCCLLVSANASYERSAQDIPILTGMEVSRGSQQRLVHRQNFELPVERDEDRQIEEISIDGDKARIRTPRGEICRWQDYKAVNLHEHCVEAFFHSNETLIEWVNQQQLSTPVTCLGDGHDGIWNLFSGIGAPHQRHEILDWFHLRENLYKVGGSQKRLAEVEALLWKGDIDSAIAEFKGWQHERVETFIAYLNHHRKRIVNYDYFNAEGISNGS